MTFGLYLHYEARLTFPKILSLTQAGAKKYNHHLDRYEPKVLMGHRYLHIFNQGAQSMHRTRF